MTITVLVAPDSFKGTYGSDAVTAALATGLAPGCTVDRCPVADGGEGTMDVLLDALGGTTQQLDVRGPTGATVSASLALLADGTTAVIEMARASGLGLMPATGGDAEATTSYGTGELIAGAVSAGATRVLVTLGGSATTDGGAGALRALTDHGVTAVEIVALCDVTTAFEDAATVFGPQKGADPVAVERLTARLRAVATSLPRDPRRKPRTGAAGGLSGALWATFDATLVSGAAFVLDAVGFDARAARAAAIVTGEGRLDESSFAGKLVGEIAVRGRAARTPVHAVVGRSELEAEQVSRRGLASVREASTYDELERAGAALASLLPIRLDHRSRPIVLRLIPVGTLVEQFPLFPLGIVALPHELVPLHIFEQRYREMTERCLEQKLEFAIVLATDDGLETTGCACAIDRVLREHDDGRLDILAVGTRPLTIRGEIEALPYPAGTVEFLDDEAEPLDALLAETARSAYAALVLAVTDEPPEVERLEQMDAYAMAATVELSLDAKQQLLRLRSENARMRLVTRLFRGALKRLDYVERAEARARSNGKVRFG